MKYVFGLFLILMSMAFAHENIPVGGMLESDYISGFGRVTVHIPDQENLTVVMDRNVCSFSRMGYVADCTEMPSENITGRAVENESLPGRWRTVYRIESTPYELHYSKNEGFKLLILEGNIVTNSIRLLRIK